MDLAFAAALAAVVLAVFARTVGYGWSNWDDGTFVLRNPLLQAPGFGSFFRLFRPGVVPRELLYIPVTYASWLVESGIAGLDPAVLHGTNLALHLLNVLLVYALLRRLAGPPIPALLGALVFAIHPIQAETVAWIMGRKDLLSTFFGLLAILAWLRFRTTDRTRWHVAALAAFLLAVFSKPGLVVLPAIFVLLDLHLGRGWRGGGLGARLPMLLVAALAIAPSLFVPGPPAPEVADPTGMKLLAVPWLAWHWLRHLLLLARPVPLYLRPDGADAATVALTGFAAVGVLAVLVVLAWRRGRRRVAGGIVAAAILLLPSVAVVFGRREFVAADRYGYLPLAAVAYALAALLAGLSTARFRVVAGLLGAGAVASLVFTLPALAVWDGPLGVFARNLEEYPGHPTSLFNHATSLAELGRYREAQAEYRELLRRFPNDAMALEYLAQTHLDSGEPEAAIPWLERAATLQPDRPQPAARLGDALLRAGRKEEAVRVFTGVLRAFPGYPAAADGLARAEMADELRRLRENPNDLEALRALAGFHRRLADAAGTLHYLRRAANLHPPDEADLRCRMAEIMISQHRPDAAREEVRRALTISPNHERAQSLRADLR